MKESSGTILHLLIESKRCDAFTHKGKHLAIKLNVPFKDRS